MNERISRAITILKTLFRGDYSSYTVWTPGPDRDPSRRVFEPLSDDALARHIYGQPGAGIGVYPLWQDNGEWYTAWFCVDIDRKDHPEEAFEIARTFVKTCHLAGVPVHPEASKRKGTHVWGFLSNPVAAWKVRAVAKWLIEKAGLPLKEVELYPNHDRIADDQKCTQPVNIPWFGSNVKLGKQAFLDATTMRPHADQIAAMETAERIPFAKIDDIIEEQDLEPSNVKSISSDATKTRESRKKAAKAASPLVLRAEPGSISSLTEGELAVLVQKLPALRACVHDAGSASYEQFLAAICHLVPFANARDLVTRIADVPGRDPGSKRYQPAYVTEKWAEALKIYTRHVVAGPSTAQLIIDNLRGGGRADIIPISMRYCVWAGCLSTRNWESTGPGQFVEMSPTPLCNFTAQVDSEDWRDDGTGSLERCVTLSGSLASGQVLPAVTIQAEEYPKLQVWMHRSWGAKIAFSPGKASVACILEAISISAQESRTTRIIAHLGWADWRGKRIFITSSGVLGLDASDADSFSAECSVEIPTEIPQLRTYCVPTTTTLEAARTAFDWVECLINLGGSQDSGTPIISTLLAAAFLAPLSSFLNLDFGVALVGETGSLKSSIVAAIMGLYGAKFTKDTLPATFISSVNFNERVGFFAKDVLFCVDNWIPGQGNDKFFVRLVHSVGDHSGRGRMTSSQALSSPKPIRGLMVTTGEDFPHSAGSAAARMIKLTAYRDVSFNKGFLASFQAAVAVGEVAPAMTWYLTWLLGKIDQPGWIDSIREAYTAIVTEQRKIPGVHGRIPEQLAWIAVGHHLMGASHPNGKWSDSCTAKQLAVACGHVLKVRTYEVGQSALPHRFASALAYLFTTGEYFGSDVSGTGIPHNPCAFGWRQCGEDFVQPVRGVPLIYTRLSERGWQVLIKPENVVASIRKHLKPEESFHESPDAIGNALRSLELLSIDEEGRNTTRVTVAGVRQRVWAIDGPKFVALMSGLSTNDSSTKEQKEPPCQA